MLNRPMMNSIELNLARIVLEQIAEGGIESVRVATIADRLEISLGLLYKRWGKREFMLEFAWRICIESVDFEVHKALTWVTPTAHALEAVYERFVFGLPQQIDAFFELHHSRCKWHRKDLEPDGMVVKSLVTYVELNLRYGHFRPAPVRAIAGCMWWFILGSMRGAHGDPLRQAWCVETLKRAVLTHEKYLALDPIEGLEITVEEPVSSEQPVATAQPAMAQQLPTTEQALKTEQTPRGNRPEESARLLEADHPLTH
jgi:AcrR family transcriptional regulator